MSAPLSPCPCPSRLCIDLLTGGGGLHVQARRAVTARDAPAPLRRRRAVLGPWDTQPRHQSGELWAECRHSGRRTPAVAVSLRWLREEKKAREQMAAQEDLTQKPKGVYARNNGYSAGTLASTLAGSSNMVWRN